MKPKFDDQENITTEMTLRTALLRLWPFIKGEWRLAVAVTGAVVFYSLVGRAIPITFGYAIDDGIKGKSLEVIYWAAGLYLGFELLRTLFSFVQEYGMQKLGNKVLFNVRQKLIAHIQALPIPYFDKTPVGRTVTRATNDISGLGELFSQSLTAIFVNALELITIVGTLFYISAKLTVLTLVVAPLAVYFSLLIGKRLRVYFREAKRRMATINAFTAESISGVKTLQLFDQTNDRRDRFNDLAGEYKDAQMKTVFSFALLWPVISFFNITTVVATLTLGAFLFADSAITIGQLTAYMVLVQSFFRPIRTLLERYTQFQSSLASADRVFALLDAPLENLEGEQANPDFKGKLEFKSLSFRYSEKAPDAVSDISFTVEPGQSVAIVGRTGSGKSTLINLLQRFYDFSNGDIQLDGQSLMKLAAQEVRSKLGVVRQDNFVFRGTIADNISLHDPEINAETIQYAAERAHLAELLSRKAHGLDSHVEERGSNLSTGEKQLVAFARVLAHDPDVLILDEATANIDSESERLVQSAMNEVRKNRTCVIIAHRLSTIESCDLIVVLDQAKVVEKGTHPELMANQGHYWQLQQAQKKALDQRDNPQSTSKLDTQL